MHITMPTVREGASKPNLTQSQQWDNLRDGGTHGSIERGYGGHSIFFWNGEVREDLSRASQYARILASIGINAVIVNNVVCEPSEM